MPRRLALAVDALHDLAGAARQLDHAFRVEQHDTTPAPAPTGSGIAAAARSRASGASRRSFIGHRGAGARALGTDSVGDLHGVEHGPQDVELELQNLERTLLLRAGL